MPRAPRTHHSAAPVLTTASDSRAALGLDAHDVPREIAQQVAARDPRRQREPLLVGRVLDAAFDLEPMPIEVGQTNAIADQSSGPLHARRAAKVARIVA